MGFTRVDYALAAARRGWHIFPLQPGEKRPVSGFTRWEDRATTDPATIRAWWRRVPDANIGIAAGPSGLVIVDLDVPKSGQVPPADLGPGITDGRDVLAALAEQAGEGLDFETFAVTTASGGLHLYYAAPSDTRWESTVGRLGWCIDTRAAGGYVVGPGSTVTGRAYAVLTSGSATPLPGWIADRLRPRPRPTVSVDQVLGELAADGRRRTAYAAAALRGELEKVLHAPEGERNKSLFIAAVSLGQLAAQGLLAVAEVEATLQAAGEAANANGAAPNSSREITATIRSGLKRGLTVPRKTRTPTQRGAA